MKRFFWFVLGLVSGVVLITWSKKKANEVADKVAAVQGVGEVGVTSTWDPPWTQANMSEVARVALDMF